MCLRKQWWEFLDRVGFRQGRWLGLLSQHLARSYPSQMPTVRRSRALSWGASVCLKSSLVLQPCESGISSNPELQENGACCMECIFTEKSLTRSGPGKG